ncbi:unnamed protein product [Notodromas monacha]|uniref:Thioredoxin domain-containing protein n=1 Tax=Notodromas monacha TaxID=399045 RepID=A0A7R9BW45_9CRUS|nr:unnamed protein product [Notodromas monacha]CAG0921875.1 unnamed protein product [Notodromas monacha]
MFSSLLPLFFILGVHAEDTVDVFNAERTLDDWNNLLLNKDFVFVNFYADWCRFSKLLAPQWQRAASIIADDSALSPKVQFARVDCDSSPMDELCKYYNVHKFLYSSAGNRLVRFLIARQEVDKNMVGQLSKMKLEKLDTYYNFKQHYPSTELGTQRTCRHQQCS